MDGIRRKEPFDRFEVHNAKSEILRTIWANDYGINFLHGGLSSVSSRSISHGARHPHGFTWTH